MLIMPAGADLVARARRVLNEAGDRVDAAVRLAGQLLLGVIPTIAPFVLAAPKRHALAKSKAWP